MHVYKYTSDLCNKKQSEGLAACNSLLHIKPRSFLPIIYNTTFQELWEKSKYKGVFSHSDVFRGLRRQSAKDLHLYAFPFETPPRASIVPSGTHFPEHISFSSSPSIFQVLLKDSRTLAQGLFPFLTSRAYAAPLPGLPSTPPSLSQSPTQSLPQVSLHREACSD